MRRAAEITDQELRDFAEWFKATFATDRQRKWMSMTFAPRCTRREWFITSIEGATHCPARDAKVLVRRMHHLKLVKVHHEYIELLYS